MLSNSLEQASRVGYLISRVVVIAAAVAAIGIALLALIASRTAGHLSRQLSRPLSEVVEWTELIARGRPLPEGPPRRGAPEFETLRRRMRKMAEALAAARERELEAERLEAFRETARRVAHELKNPLTPIRLAVASLRRATEGDSRMTEIIEVLETESRRLEVMARSFSQFGTLPEGTAADVDLVELARAVAHSLSSDGVHGGGGDAEEELPLVRGFHDALSRALTNIVINAIEACPPGGAVTIIVGKRWHRGEANGRDPRAGHRRGHFSRDARIDLAAVRDEQARRHGARSRDRATDDPRAPRARAGEQHRRCGNGDHRGDSDRWRRRANSCTGGVMDIPGELIPIVLFIMMGVTAIGWPIARALARKMDREAIAPKIPLELSGRLERMEQAIDSIAVEVERISEGQRFTTKLLSERQQQQLPPQAAVANGGDPGHRRRAEHPADGRRDPERRRLQRARRGQRRGGRARGRRSASRTRCCSIS